MIEANLPKHSFLLLSPAEKGHFVKRGASSTHVSTLRRGCASLQSGTQRMMF